MGQIRIARGSGSLEEATKHAIVVKDASEPVNSRIQILRSSSDASVDSMFPPRVLSLVHSQKMEQKKELNNIYKTMREEIKDVVSGVGSVLTNLKETVTEETIEEVQKRGLSYSGSFKGKFEGDGSKLKNLRWENIIGKRIKAGAGGFKFPLALITASFADSASFASTASLLLGSVESASFAETSSFAQSASFAQTASLLLGSVESASFAITASYVAAANVDGVVESASFAKTASLVRGAVTGTLTGSVIGNVISRYIAYHDGGVPGRSFDILYWSGSNQLISRLEDGTFWQTVESASGDVTYEGSVTASDFQGVQTASFAQTASLLLGSIESASFAETASFALSGGGGGGGVFGGDFSGTFSGSVTASLEATGNLTGTFSGSAYIGGTITLKNITAANGVKVGHDSASNALVDIQGNGQIVGMRITSADNNALLQLKHGGAAKRIWSLRSDAATDAFVYSDDTAGHPRLTITGNGGNILWANTPLMDFGTANLQNISTITGLASLALDTGTGVVPLSIQRNTNSLNASVLAQYRMKNSSSGWRNYAQAGGLIISNTAGSEAGAWIVKTIRSVDGVIAEATRVYENTLLLGATTRVTASNSLEVTLNALFKQDISVTNDISCQTLTATTAILATAIGQSIQLAGAAHTDAFVSFANNRAHVGYHASGLACLIQGGGSKGIDFRVGSNTWGAGILALELSVIGEANFVGAVTASQFAGDLVGTAATASFLDPTPEVTINIPSAYFNDGITAGNNILLADTAIVPNGAISVYTMETWINPSKYLAFGGPFALGAGGDVLLWHLNTSGLQDVFGGGSAADGKLVVPVNAWTHIALAVTGTVWELYHNGLLEASGTGASAATLTNGRRIAGDGNMLSEQMAGFLSDLRFWTAKRTPSEIFNNYKSRLDGDEAGLAGYWKLDEDPSSSIAFNSADGKASDSGTLEAGAVGKTGSLFIPNVAPSVFWTIS